MMREGFAFSFDLNKIPRCSFVSVLSMCFVQACLVQVVILEHGALGICKSTKIVDLSPLPSHLLVFFLMSERSGRRSQGRFYRGNLLYTIDASQEGDDMHPRMFLPATCHLTRPVYATKKRNRSSATLTLNTAQPRHLEEMGTSDKKITI